MTLRRGALALIPLCLLLVACGAGPERAPVVDLNAVAFPLNGLPDPCEVLRASGVESLLVRPLDEEPIRAPGFCLLQVARGERFELQTSAALELAIREEPAPTDMDGYVEQFGEGLTMAGCTRDDVEQLPGLGDFSIWFAHEYPPETTTITLSSFWGDGRFLSLEIHRIDREIALAWAKDVAAGVIERVAAADEGQTDESLPQP